jgi:hypothetical protein
MIDKGGVFGERVKDIPLREYIRNELIANILIVGINVDGLHAYYGMEAGEYAALVAEVRQQIKDGNLAWPFSRPSLAEFEAEFRGWPSGQHNDGVDALAWTMANMPRPEPWIGLTKAGLCAIGIGVTALVLIAFWLWVFIR